MIKPEKPSLDDMDKLADDIIENQEEKPETSTRHMYLFGQYPF